MGILYYGITFGEFEVMDFKTDFLSGVRSNFFSSGNIQQTNKSIQVIDNNKYAFSYDLKQSAPLKWKQSFNEILSQYTTIELDGSYCVHSLGKNKSVFKSSYFDKSHIWIKTDYLNNNSLICSIYPSVENNEDILVIKRYYKDNTTVTNLYPKLEIPINNNYCVLAFTDSGFLYFNEIKNNCNLTSNNQEQKSNYGFNFNVSDFDLNKNFNDTFNIVDSNFLTDESVNSIDTEELTIENELPLEETVIADESYTVSNVVETPDIVVDSCGESYNYFGSVSKDGKRSGYGRTVTPEGKTAYEGEYKDDKRNGFGSFYYKNGYLNYVGNWSDNYRQGFGIGFRSSDFTSHIGNWNNNIPDGIGARFDKDGNFLFLGKFVNGKKEGLGITIDENGDFIVSRFENDEVISSKPLE